MSLLVRFQLFFDWNIHQYIFLSNCCFLVIVVLLIDIYFCVVSLRCNQSFFALFYVLFESSYWCIDLIMNAGKSSFAFLFCVCHLSCVRPYASPWIFLFSSPFVEVLPSFTSRIVLSILQGWQPRCLYLSWDFCYIVWFRVAFSFYFISFYFIPSSIKLEPAFNMPKSL